MHGKADPSRLAFLDAARGIAALLVVIEHGVHACVPAFGEWSATHHIHLGRIGVMLFLTISGFIIPQSIQQGGSNARFWLRRFFRLFPAYWVSILVTYLYARLGGPYVSVPLDDTATWLVNLTMLQGFVDYPPVLGIFWTLQIELILYFSCSVLLSLRLFGFARILLAILAGAILFAGTYVARKVHHPLVLVYALHFAAPMVGYVAHDLLHGRGSRRFSIALLAALILVPLGIYVYNFKWLLPEHALFFVKDYCVHYLVAYLLFFLMAMLSTRQLPWAFCRLGRISYSVYLMHPLFVTLALNRPWPAWLLFSGILTATLLASEMCFRWVEEPSIALGRWIERRLLQPKKATAQAAAVVPAERRAA